MLRALLLSILLGSSPAMPAFSFELFRGLDGNSFAGAGAGLASSRIQADNFEAFAIEDLRIESGEVIDLSDILIPIETISVDGVGDHGKPPPGSPPRVDVSLPDGGLGRAYETFLHLHGGVRPLTLIAASDIPRGLLISLDTERTKNAETHGHASLRLAGHPIEQGSFEAYVTLADAHGTESTLELALHVADSCAASGEDSDADSVFDDRIGGMARVSHVR
jgi:hypothetical protein